MNKTRVSVFEYDMKGEPFRLGLVMPSISLTDYNTVKN